MRRETEHERENKDFYGILKETRDGNARFSAMESVECIDSALYEQGVKADKYYPDIDYHRAFDRIIGEAQWLDEAAYDSGFDKTGKEFNGTWHGLRATALEENLIPMD